MHTIKVLKALYNRNNMFQPYNVCECTYVSLFVCVCTCVYIMYVCVCVCMCVYVMYVCMYNCESVCTLCMCVYV